MCCFMSWEYPWSWGSNPAGDDEGKATVFYLLVLSMDKNELRHSNFVHVSDQVAFLCQVVWMINR
jgi:hypothetical protein